MNTEDLIPLESGQVPVDTRDQIGREVAHELNNILTVIRGYTDLLLHRVGRNSPLSPELQLIADNAKRAELVVRRSPRVGQQRAA